MKGNVVVVHDPAESTLTDKFGVVWVPLNTTAFSMEVLIQIASSCGHMPGLMDAVEKEMLKAFEEGESK